VAVVRGRRKKEPVLEEFGERTYRHGKLAVGGIRDAAGRGGVMRLVEDEHGAGAERTQHLGDTVRIGLVREQVVGDDEAGADRPRVGRKTVVPADRGKIVAIDDREAQAEFLRQLVLPLRCHRCRTGYDHIIDAAAQKHFPEDKSCLDGFAQADVICDKQIDPWQPERLGERQ
jgi:hypothetical protein